MCDSDPDFELNMELGNYSQVPLFFLQPRRQEVVRVQVLLYINYRN